MKDVRLSVILDLRRTIEILEDKVEELEAEVEYQRIVIERLQKRQYDETIPPF